MSAALRDRATELARAELRAGVKEVGGPNRGPRVEQYLARVHVPPGQPWCCAAAFWCVDEACRELGIPNPLPRTGKVTTLWHLAPPWLKTLVPVRGALFLHVAEDEADVKVNEPDRVCGPGHIGFVQDVNFPEMRLFSVEGNTNARGSRNGDRWGEHSRPFDYVNVGFIDLGRLAPTRAA